jgi:nitroreductase
MGRDEVQGAGHTGLEPPLDAAWEALALRFSVSPRHLSAPAPTPAQWQAAVELAARAPDHRSLRPFRFVRVDDTQRAALAELFARGAIERGLAPAEVQAARDRAFNGPGLVALVVQARAVLDDVPVHEHWVCAGAALMNLLNALHLMGFGAKTLSGSSVSDPAVAQAFCREGEQLVAWVIAGTPRHAAHARRGADAPVLGNWCPPTDPNAAAG